MKKLLILGGFPQMIEVVETAHKMNIYVIVVDRDENSPAKQFADKAFNVSTDQISILEKICIEEGVTGIFTGFEDFNIHIACELCERLGLPFYANKEQLSIITNKRVFKEICKKNDIPIVEQYTFEEAIEKGKYPYIIKPSDSYGSRGITVCKSKNELIEGYKKAVVHSKTQDTIIERFIESEYGTEMFYTIVNENIHLTATADRYIVRTGEKSVPLPSAEIFPSRHQKEMVDLLDANIRKMLNSMKIKNGLVLIQMLYQNGEFFIYEMAYRLTGEQHFKLVEKQQGINLLEMMINLAIGESINNYDSELIDLNSFKYPAANLTVLLKEGIIHKINGVEMVCKMREIVSYILTHKEKDVIEARGDYSHILIRINLVADDCEKLSVLISKINTFICVTDQKGQDMIISKFVFPQRL